MHITFSPQRRDDSLTLSKDGETLNVNGEVFDLSGLAEGESLPGVGMSAQLLASARRISGELYVNILLPLGSDATEAERYPAAIENVPDGVVALPGDLNHAPS